MYAPHSPVLSSLDRHSMARVYPGGGGGGGTAGLQSPTAMVSPWTSQCLRFKYFVTFIICTTSLALLSGSLATHKWIVSKPMRVLRLAQANNMSSPLMLTSGLHHHHQHHHHGHRQQRQQAEEPLRPILADESALAANNLLLQFAEQPVAGAAADGPSNAGPNGAAAATSGPQTSNKFRGDIYFGLFKGVKMLNYGFGDRLSTITVYRTSGASSSNNNNPQQELVDFKLWLLTVACVALAILFALLGSIFAIINFVITPRGRLTGPLGLVIWNLLAAFSCLLAIVTWFIEYFIKLKANVLNPEEVANGWTSDKRSQFGYSYYFVVIAFVLHLVNIFIVSLVQFESWNSKTANGDPIAGGTLNGGGRVKRNSHSAHEGVIMLY